jgi:hypothetical protein
MVFPPTCSCLRGLPHLPLPALRAELPTPALPQAVAVVCHDAGAANLILPWLQDPALRVQALMQGPALLLWNARYGHAAAGAHPHKRLCSSLDEALQDAPLLLSGTGWASDLEHTARLRAAARGLRSAAVIDHWVNYPERFVRGGVQQWPDQFWLTDAHAVTLAARHFPTERLRCYRNRYLDEQVAAIAPVPAAPAGDVLLVMEPVRHPWPLASAAQARQPGEFQALDWFMQQWRSGAVAAAAGIPAGTPLRLRPHPSDPAGKYKAWLQRHPMVQLCNATTLASAISPARWVLGCESMALVVAAASGRDALSLLPPWAPPCRLPPGWVRALGQGLPVQRGQPSALGTGRGGGPS